MRIAWDVHFDPFFFVHEFPVVGRGQARCTRVMLRLSRARRTSLHPSLTSQRQRPAAPTSPDAGVTLHHPVIPWHDVCDCFARRGQWTRSKDWCLSEKHVDRLIQTIHDVESTLGQMVLDFKYEFVVGVSWGFLYRSSLAEGCKFHGIFNGTLLVLARALARF